MPTRSDIEVIAIDASLNRIRPVGNLVAAEIKPVLNPTSSRVAGTTSITVPPDDNINAILSRKGTRLLVRYRDADEMSGLIRTTEPVFTPDGEPIYEITDDQQVLAETSAFVAPVAKSYPSGTGTSGLLHPTSLTDDGQAVSTVAHPAGTDAGYGGYVFDDGTTAAETAIKEVIRRNLVTRLGPAWSAARGGLATPWTIGADLQRGGDAFTTGKLPVLRFDSIADGLDALLTWSGLRLRVLQSSASLLPGATRTIGIDVSVPRTFPQILTYASGVVQSGKPTATAPTATRGVILGAGTDTARDYSSVANTALEAQWGLVAETTRDASGADQTWPSSVSAALQVAKYFLLRSEVSDAAKATYSAALAQAGRELLADGAAKSGLSMTLAETDTFRYGGTTADGRVQLGDTVRVQAFGDPATAPIFSGQVTSATITLERKGQVTAVPVIGERTDDPDEQLQSALLELDAAFRRFTTRK